MIFRTILILAFVSVIITLASATDEGVSLESENLMVQREKRDTIKVYEGSGEDTPAENTGKTTKRPGPEITVEDTYTWKNTDTTTKITNTPQVSEQVKTRGPKPITPTQICKGFSCVSSFQAKADGMPLRSGASLTLFLSSMALFLMVWL